jgi:hypothetical protein
MMSKFDDERFAALESLIAESLDAINKALGLMLPTSPADEDLIAHLRRTVAANAKIIRNIVQDGVP